MTRIFEIQFYLKTTKTLNVKVSVVPGTDVNAIHRVFDRRASVVGGELAGRDVYERGTDSTFKHVSWDYEFPTIINLFKFVKIYNGQKKIHVAREIKSTSGAYAAAISSAIPTTLRFT